MYLVIGKENNQILCISKTIDYQSNGNPVGDEFAVAVNLVDRVEEVEGVPDYVVEDLYAYSEGVYTQIEENDELADAVAALEILGYTEEANE